MSKKENHTNLWGHRVDIGVVGFCFEFGSQLKNCFRKVTDATNQPSVTVVSSNAQAEVPSTVEKPQPPLPRATFVAVPAVLSTPVKPPSFKGNASAVQITTEATSVQVVDNNTELTPAEIRKRKLEAWKAAKTAQTEKPTIPTEPTVQPALDENAGLTPAEIRKKKLQAWKAKISNVRIRSCQF
jgi:hypothetical protein